MRHPRAQSKPSTVANGRREPTVAKNRREFIKGAGFALLAVQCLPADLYASGVPSRDSAPSADDLVIESGPGAFHHVHYLHIPRAFLKSPPPGGAKLITSKAFLHQHHITLTAKELRGVGEGETVIQRASSHVFVIALAKGVSEPTT